MEGNDQSVNNTPPAVPASTGAGGAGGYTVPEGHRLVRSDEYDTLSRYKQQFEGSKPLLDAAIRHGFKDQSAFDQYGRFSGLIQKHGFKSLDDFARVLEAPDDPAAPAETQTFDPNKLREAGFVTSDALEKTRAELRHEREIEKQEARIASAREEVLKGVASKRDRELIGNTFENILWQSASLYGDDHPLKGSVAPFTEEAIGKAVEAVKKMIAIQEAEDAAAIGQAAARGAPAKPPAGTSGGAGKPAIAATGGDWREEVRKRDLPKRGQPVG